jgi:hypothetical protein
MKVEELCENILIENRMVWRKSGKTIKRGVRCTAGPRSGRVVSSAARCAGSIDLKKRFRLKKLKAKMGKRMARRAQRTKRINPTSKRIKSLNKPARRR